MGFRLIFSHGIANRSDLPEYCLNSPRNLLSRVLFFGLMGLLLACGSSPGDVPAPAGPAWLARIGNQAVEAQEFQAYLEQQTCRNPRLQVTPAIKRDLLEKYLEKKLLLAEASRQRLSEQPEIIKELKEMKEQILIKQLFAIKEKEMTGQIKIGEDEIRNYYGDMGQIVQFRYVSADGPDQAKVVADQWVQKVSPSEAVDSGEVSLAALNESWKKQIPTMPIKKPQVVKIDSHWLVIEVVNKRAEPVLPLEKVRDQIVRELTDREEKERLQNWVNSLKGQNRLEINPAHN
jgi:hypothetical protein